MICSYNQAGDRGLFIRTLNYSFLELNHKHTKNAFSLAAKWLRRGRQRAVEGEGDMEGSCPDILFESTQVLFYRSNLLCLSMSSPCNFVL